MSELQQFINNQVPEGWTTKPFWSMFRRVKYTNFPNEELLSVYRDYGVIPKSSRDDNHNKASEDLSNYQLIDKGWLVTNKMKAWQGSIAISRHRGIVSPAYYAYKPLSKEHDQFLHYLLRSYPYIALYKRISKGVRVNQWDLEHEALRTAPILLPSYDVQKEIADFLDQETARIDQLIEKKKTLSNLLIEKRKNTISSAIAGNQKPYLDFPRTPYKVKFLADLASKKVSYGEIEADYTGLEHIKSWTGKIIKNIDSIPEGLVTIFKSGDVLFGKLRPNLAKVASPDFSGVCSTEALVLRPNSKVDSEYLKYSMLEQSFIEDVVSSTYGAKMPRASWDFIGSKIIQIPSIDNQKLIVSLLKKTISEIDKAKQKTKKSIIKLQNYKTALITEAVTGQLDIEAWKNRNTVDRRLDKIEEEMAS